MSSRPPSDIPRATAHLEARVEIRVAARLTVARATLREGLSERTRVEVEVAADDEVDFGPVLGDEATLSLDVAPAGSRRWSLVVGAASFVEHEGGVFRYRLELFDAAWMLGFAKTTRKFRNQSARQIVSRVLDEGRVRHRWATVSELPVRKYCTQYRETNLAFVERLLEFEGVYFSFDDDGVMVLGDTSPAAPLLSAAPMELIEAEGALSRGELGIHRFVKGAEVRTGRVTLADFNWKKPDLDLVETASANEDAGLERFEPYAGFRLPHQGARLAKMRLEAHRVGARFVEGSSNVPRFAPGAAFAIAEPSGASEWLLVRVEHTYANASAETGDARYENTFVGMPRAAHFRPMPRTPRPRVDGLHTAMVRGPDEVHTDEYGRFRAQFHWDREGTETAEDSRWVRALQETATSMALSRTGWEVFVGYVDSDPDRPIGVGRAINALAAPTFGLPAHKTMMAIRTPTVGGGARLGGAASVSVGGGTGVGFAPSASVGSATPPAASGGGGAYNEITMDDQAGSQSINIRAQKDLIALVKNDKSETIGNDETHAVGTDFTRAVRGNQSLTIGANATASYGAMHQLVVSLDRTKQVGASETVTIGKSLQAAVGGDEKETVGSLRLTIAGSIAAPDFKAFAQSAESLALGFVRNAAPGLASAYDAAEAVRGEAGSFGFGTFGAAAGSAGRTALGTALAAFYGNGGAGAAAGAAAQSAVTTFEGSIQHMIPTTSQLTALAPSPSWLPTTESLDHALDQAEVSAIATLEQTLTIDAAINLVCHGGITRDVSASMFKRVGAAYITVAVLGVESHVGLGYVETVGGIKLTLARGKIDQSVGAILDVTVGAVVRRKSKAITISSGTDSHVKAVAAAKYEADTSLDLLGRIVEVDGSADVSLVGGGASIDMDSASITLTGNLSLDAGRVITLFGAGLLDVT